MANLVLKMKGSSSGASIASSLKYAHSHSHLPSFLHDLGESVGVASPQVTVQILNDNAAAASATVTMVTADMADGDTIQIGAMLLTAKAAGAVGAQFNIGLTDAASATNLTAAINANSSSLLSAGAVAAVVTVSASITGPLGNAIPIIVTQVDPGMTPSASALSGGADDTALAKDYRSF